MIKEEKTGVASMPHGASVSTYQIIRDYLYSDRHKNLSFNTKKMYNSVINRLEDFTLPDGKPFFNVNVQMIDHKMVDYLKAVLNHTLKPATICLYFAVMSAVWELALRHGKASNNPWANARIKIDNFRDVLWSIEQIELAIETAKKLNFNVLALYIKLAYATAQRPWSDLRNLKWDNLKQEEDSYILDFVIQKTNTHILLPLPKDVAQLLNSIPRISEYIFVDKDGNRPSASVITKMLNTVKKKAGLDPRLLIRDLRRSAVTELAMSGATTSEIQAITGWRITDKMLQRYAILKLETARSALEKREAYNAAKSVRKGNEVLPWVKFKA